MSAELILEAHPVNNWSEGPSNVLTVDLIAARMSLDTHLSELVVSEHDRSKIFFCLESSVLRLGYLDKSRWL